MSEKSDPAAEGQDTAAEGEPPAGAGQDAATVRTTAPQSAYGNREVAIGAVVLLVGLALAYLLPLTAI